MKTLDDFPRKAPLGFRLEAAAMRGDLSEAMLSLAEGASPGARGWHGWRPLHLACGAVEEPQYGKVMAKAASFRLPADSTQRNELAVLLIVRAGGVDSKDGRGATAAHWAAKWGLCGCLEALRKAGANLDARDNSGRSPLMWAAGRTDAYAPGGAIDALLGWGVKINDRDSSGLAALHHASRDPGALAALLRSGASHEARSALGRTALHEACLANRVSSVAVLLADGADALARDSKGRYAHELGGGKAARVAFAAHEGAQMGLAMGSKVSSERLSRRM